MQYYNLQVPDKLDGQRLDKAANLLTNEISRTRIQKAIKNANVKLNGIVISDANIKVKANDSIEIALEEHQETDMLPASIALDIVYEDRELIIVNKPAGLTVHPGAGNHQDTLANALLNHTKSLSSLSGASRPGIVHRLDKDTSGLMVVAKNDIIHAKLSALIEKRELVRKYKALVWGVPVPSSGAIRKNIGRSRLDRTKMSVLKTGGKVAVTHYKLERIFADGLISLIECKLETGRTHQIRVHLSHFGHSIVGDQAYGHNKRKAKKLLPELESYLTDFNRQALHSFYLGFIHPTSDKMIEFCSELPYDISKIIQLLD